MALSMLAVTSLLFSSVLASLWWIRRRNSKLALYGPPRVPLGARLLIARTKGGVEMFRIMMRVCHKFGNKHGIFLMPSWFHSIYVITKAETAEVLLSNSKNISKSMFYKFLLPWLGNGLLLSTGEKWYSRRKMLTPTFHFKILEDFLQVFNEQSSVMVDRLDSMVDRGRFVISPYVTLCALDIICVLAPGNKETKSINRLEMTGNNPDTAMGKHIDAQSNSNSEYVKAVYRISDIVITRMKRPNLWPDFLFRLTSRAKEHERCLRILHDFTDQVIRERRAELGALRRRDAQSVAATEKNVEVDDEESAMRMTPKRKRLAFLDLLLEMAVDSGSLNDEDLREEVNTFMFEGHDTTAAATTWAIHLIGANPDVQVKLQEELDRIFDDSDRPVTMDDIRELKYMECVVKESLRLFPSVPLFGRSITEDCVIGGYNVPKGVTTLVMTSIIHMDPKHFPDPERFDPDRWLPENSVDRHPFAFIPFSAGIRNCIGQRFAMIEEKVLLTRIFRKFKVTALQTRKELRPCGELILRPEDGVIVSIEPRSSPITISQLRNKIG